MTSSQQRSEETIVFRQPGSHAAEIAGEDRDGGMPNQH